ncbi:hypothetical protein GCM10010274_60420 [Streptomyces lavendofoliae]|uniref:Uncharacterized protein n=1 Tax=Streptomyces lavendofoliae TaxID=67314 RepID=A0A918I445_9ACTN|nr:hypothetical protein GCM10010274_60420 [Streptomyces lavendofoliae]
MLPDPLRPKPFENFVETTFLTFGGNIIEAGTDSYRLATTRARAEQQPVS